MQNEQRQEEKPLKKTIEDKANHLNQNKGKVAAKTILQVKFNPKDPLQQFYKETLVIVPKETALVKVGWKVANLQRSEEDLALKCFHLLPTELLFPINVYTNLIQCTGVNNEPKRSIKCLWVQETIHTFVESKDQTNQANNVSKTRIFEFVQNALLPRAKNFIDNYLSWEAQVKNEYDEQKIIGLFHSQVIDEANRWIKQFNSVCLD